MVDTHNIWTLILAGGEGRRLRSLTRTAAGVCVPKQFCSLLGGPSLLEQTLDRARQISRNEHVCAVVAAHQQRWWQPLLTALPASNVLIEPESRGTAVGILMGLLHIVATDPGALVVLMPADHYVQDTIILACALRAAEAHVRQHREHIVLLGMQSERPDPELGYIIPSDVKDDGVYRICGFIEKPTMRRCIELTQAGAVLNAFIIVAKATALLELFSQRYPQVIADMRVSLMRRKRGEIDAANFAEFYARLPTIDFSRQLLEQQPSPALRLLPVQGCGWSDLGTPEHVMQTLKSIHPGATRHHIPAYPAPVTLSGAVANCQLQ